ncbi:MAG: exosortase/archaeosortase family protein [Acidobacteriota bacterium]|nr:exosortase/archaeosortase family protein [Acidobacteriota bacterium]
MLRDEPLTRLKPVESAWVEWAPLFWFSALLLGSYAIVLSRLARQWVTDQDMTHGVFVPFLVLYVVWQKRQELASVESRHNILGLALMLIGAFLLCIGPPGLDTFATVTRIAFVFSLLGTILYLRGWPTIRVLLYPLALLILMFPMPGFILEKLTFPLQLIASKLAEHMLELMRYSVLREGNILILPGQTLNIAEACSGLRSMMALTFLGQAYIYLFDSRPWMRIAIALLVVPIAVLANCLRIVASAVAGSYNREWGEGTYHESTGWIVFVVAFVCVVAAHASINALSKLARRQ